MDRNTPSFITKVKINNSPLQGQRNTHQRFVADLEILNRPKKIKDFLFRFFFTTIILATFYYNSNL